MQCAGINFQDLECLPEETFIQGIDLQLIHCSMIKKLETLIAGELSNLLVASLFRYSTLQFGNRFPGRSEVYLSVFKYHSFQHPVFQPMMGRD
jgi:hypothetical protein